MAGEAELSDQSVKDPDHRSIIHFTNLVQDGLDELKFIRSWQDFEIFRSKFNYVLSRILGLHAKVGRIPPSIQVEPTNYCNARCICCSTARSTRKKGFMDFDLFTKIIDDAAQNKIKRIHLYLHGEPMLHPKIVEMIGYIKNRGLAVHLTTNGMFFDRERIIAILNANVNSADHFVFSILGGSKETHEDIMKRVNHERVMQNISTFLALRKEYQVNGPVISTMFYLMPENLSEVSLYLKTYRGLVDHAGIAGAISSSFSRYDATKIDQSIRPRTKTCSQLWERLSVFWNGDVTICPQDVDGGFVFGNLSGQSIHEVCMNDDFLNIKRIHSHRQFEKLSVCYGCDW